MKAYIFVETKAGQAQKVAQRIRKLTGVKQADCCWGRPDVFVFVEVAGAKALGNLVIARISRVPGVQATETHIAIAP